MKTSCWRFALGCVGCSTAVSATIDYSVRFVLCRPRHVCWPGRVCCVGLGSSCPTCSVSARDHAPTCPRGQHLCLHMFFCAVLAVTASCYLRVKLSCIYRPLACLPSIQAFRVKASYSLHPRAGENKPVACGASAPICHPLHSALALGFSSVWYLSFPWLLQLGSGLTSESHVLALASGIILHVVSIYFCCYLFLTQRSFL